MQYRPTSSALLLTTLAAVALAGAPLRQAGAAGVTLSGFLNVTWVCGETRPGGEVEYSLTPDRGAPVPLQLDPKLLGPLGGVQALRGHRLVVEGEPGAGPRAQADGAPTPVTVRALRPAEELGAAAFVPIGEPMLGSKPYITLLLRFADTTKTTPKPASYFQTLLGATAPEVDNFYRTASYGQFNIQGSKVAGWLNLPKARSGYAGSTAGLDLDKVLADAIRVAQNSVHFPDYYGINLIFNVNPYSGNLVGMGGWRYLQDLQGSSRTYGVTWIGEYEQCVVAHEMGHSLGLPHSSGPYSQTYDSHWDVMSYPFLTPNASLGRVAEGTISFHKDLVGWIAPDRKYVPGGTSQATITLSPLDAAPSGRSFAMAQVPIGATGKRFYTVDSRRLAGYDANIPAAGVILHLVDLNRDVRVAQVVDSDGNGNPNDAAAVWTAGETFTDAASAVQMSVLASGAAGSTVTITTGLLPPASFQAKAVSQTQVQLTWKNVGATVKQIVVERRSGAAAFAPVATLAAAAAAFSDSALAPKTAYAYRLRVSNSTVAAVSPEVSVTTLGGAGGKLQVPARLAFGAVSRGKGRTLSLVIKNASRTEKLEIQVSSPGAPFTIPATISTLVAPTGKRTLRVSFRPTAKGAARGTLQIQSSDPYRANAVVQLTGSGK